MDAITVDTAVLIFFLGVTALLLVIIAGVNQCCHNSKTTLKKLDAIMIKLIELR